LANGVKAEEFADKFNKDSKNYEEGVLIPCVIFISPLKTFIYEMRTPTVSFLLDRGYGGEIVDNNLIYFYTNKRKLLKAVYNTMLIKTNGNEHYAISYGLVKQILGTARSMGITCNKNFEQREKNTSSFKRNRSKKR
jgi:large subunit ribosomal protein L11